MKIHKGTPQEDADMLAQGKHPMEGAIPKDKQATPDAKRTRPQHGIGNLHDRRLEARGVYSQDDAPDSPLSSEQSDYLHRGGYGAPLRAFADEAQLVANRAEWLRTLSQQDVKERFDHLIRHLDSQQEKYEAAVREKEPLVKIQNLRGNMNNAYGLMREFHDEVRRREMNPLDKAILKLEEKIDPLHGGKHFVFGPNHEANRWTEAIDHQPRSTGESSPDLEDIRSRPHADYGYMQSMGRHPEDPTQPYDWDADPEEFLKTPDEHTGGRRRGWFIGSGVEPLTEGESYDEWLKTERGAERKRRGLDKALHHQNDEGVYMSHDKELYALEKAIARLAKGFPGPAVNPLDEPEAMAPRSEGMKIRQIPEEQAPPPNFNQLKAPKFRSSKQGSRVAAFQGTKDHTATTNHIFGAGRVEPRQIDFRKKQYPLDKATIALAQLIKDGAGPATGAPMVAAQVSTPVGGSGRTKAGYVEPKRVGLGGRPSEE